ncbi:MAG: VWA domain-containing protein [Deltaproteobacteria bacterium]|nr:VWA domain-containing protein [Deltaproteobacteria bacterium]
MKRALPLLLGLLAVTTCTKARFVPEDKPDPARRDDRLTVDGEFCTTNPETLNFPVKLLFLVDRSQSMNVTDPDTNIAPPGDPPVLAAHRVRALLDAIDALSSVVGLEFGVIGFGASTTPETERCDQYTPTRVNCAPGFTTNLAEARGAALRTGNPGAGNTDFAAALATAYTLLFRDMSALSEQDAGNARYVIILLSDGLADLDVTANDRGQSIGDIIDDIVALKKRFRLRQLQLNTALLSAGITRQDVYDLARAGMQAMAQRGGGVFRDFRNGGDINFLQFDVTSYRRVYTLKTLLVANLNAKPGLGDDITDSDGDGLTDTEEAQIGSNPLSADTDGDFFNDLLEHRLRTSGLDPLDPSDGDCALEVDRLDADGDGLRDCEERYMGTRPKRFDTDFDGVPDYPEVWFDTLPTIDDLAQDLDFDGSRNGEELRWHANPRSNDSANLSDLGYRYVLQDLGLNDQSQYCYRFTVSNVRLASTRALPGGRQGQNRVLVYVTEVPLDDPGDVARYRVGCVTARYIASADVKDPPNGKVSLLPPDRCEVTDGGPAPGAGCLVDPVLFDPAVHCAGR